MGVLRGILLPSCQQSQPGSLLHQNSSARTPPFTLVPGVRRRSHMAPPRQAATMEPVVQSFKPHEHKKSYESKYTGEALDDSYETMFTTNKERRAGVILHPTSLPGPYGIGELGEESFRFIDWLVEAGLQAWQVLPLVPPEEDYWSPYSGLDALCGNVLLICLDSLVADGLLEAADLPPKQPVADVDYPAVKAMKTPLLKKAADKLLGKGEFEAMFLEMEAWRKRNQWVEDSALFYAIATFEEELQGTPWWTWPEGIKFRETREVRRMREKHHDEIQRFIALQFLWDKQWIAVKTYANDRNVIIIGDMPIYVGGQSADVWAYQDLFELDGSGAPVEISGVPPDAFSETGQLWGSPLYDWKEHEKDRFKWWVQRLTRSFHLHDVTRIDHFRGFAGYWAVDAGAETAMGGVWKKGPNRQLFDALQKAMGDVPIIAEDLGVITPDVVDLREAIGAPGMVVLQFAWGSGASNVHLPHNHYENSVCYPGLPITEANPAEANEMNPNLNNLLRHSIIYNEAQPYYSVGEYYLSYHHNAAAPLVPKGTHDNETSVGWWTDSATKVDKEYFCQYLNTDGLDPAWTFIREAYKSVSKTSVFLMQDVMRLDNSARMNFPGKAAGNWAWRIGESDIWGHLRSEAEGLHKLAATYDRLPPKPEDNGA